jgi:hypothetical protein
MQIVITQNIKDFVGSEEIARKSTAIINACQYSFIFALAPNDMDDLCKLYEKAGGINESEQEQITTAPRGQTFAIMSPSSRTTFRIEAPGSVVQMFRKPNFVSQYFVGEEGERYWEEFVGISRWAHLDNKMSMLDEEVQETQPHERKAITFVELDEEEIQAIEEKERVMVEEIVAPKPIEQETVAEPIRQETIAEPIQPQVVHTVIQQASTSDAAVQQLTKFLGDFSFDAIRSEIEHRVEELRRDLEEKANLQMNSQPEQAEAAATATFQIETAKIAVPKQEADQVAAPEPEQMDYSDLILSDDNEPDDDESDDTEDNSSGGIDIMALLSAQAKKMESISPIDMMEMYGESFSEITLEELEQYINSNRKE